VSEPGTPTTPEPSEEQPTRPAGEPAPRDAAPTEEELRTATRVQRRREPRYGVFIATGAVLGIVVAFVLTLLSDPTEYSAGSVLGYLVTVLAVLGGLLGGLAAVLAARRR